MFALLCVTLVIASLSLLVGALVLWKLLSKNKDSENTLSASTPAGVQSSTAERAQSAAPQSSNLLPEIDIAADLISPLTQIKDLAEKITSTETPLSDQNAASLNAILDKSTSMADKLALLEDCRALDCGDASVQKTNTSIYEVTNEVLQDYNVLAESSGIRLLNDIDKKAPPVNADPKIIRRVLRALVDNAIRHAKGSYVKVSGMQSATSYHISVIDNGQPIPEGNWGKLFKKPEHAYQKGLYLCQQLTQAHGGSIWISHNQNGGNIFTFSVPSDNDDKKAGTPQDAATNKTIGTGTHPSNADARSTDQDAATAGETATASSKQTDLSAQDSAKEKSFCIPTKILVVDDDPINRMVLQGMLKNQYELEEACDGVEAVAMVEKGKPSLILMDVMMPRMSGYEACAEIRKHYDKQTLPIVFITAKRAEDEEGEVERTGGSAMLTKPIIKDVLLDNIHNFIANKNSQESA